MAGKPGRFTWNGLRIYVLHSCMDGTFPGSGKRKFYDHYRNRSADRRVWCDKDDREYIREKQA